MNSLPSVEKGDRIYAIGDVHGCYDLLCRLLDKISRHSSRLPEPQSLYIVVLGDIIDRGPDSAKVVELLFDLQSQDDNLIVLMGNHEEAMLRSLDGDAEMMRRWLMVGGKETLQSFGVRLPAQGEDLTQYSRNLKSQLPRRQIEWLKKLPLTARSGDYFFCHAGIRPGVALRRQTKADLLWIREDFVDDETIHEAVIVHGHTIDTQVNIKSNRIAVDTGAYRSGLLSAIYLENDRIEKICT